MSWYASALMSVCPPTAARKQTLREVREVPAVRFPSAVHQAALCAKGYGARRRPVEEGLGAAQTMEERMRVLTINELWRLTRIELIDVASKITAALPTFPEKSAPAHRRCRPGPRTERRHRDVMPKTLNKRYSHREGRLSLPSTSNLPKRGSLVKNFDKVQVTLYLFAFPHVGLLSSRRKGHSRESRKTACRRYRVSSIDRSVQSFAPSARCIHRQDFE
jgi:hypothetical protein